MTPSSVALAIFIAISLLSPPSVLAQQTSADGMSTQEEQQMREAGKKLPPAELERLISEIKARRHKAANYRAAPTKTRKELVSIIDRMRKENTASSAKRFAADRDELGSRIYWFSQNHVAIPSDVGNQVAEALIDIYAKRPPTADHLPISVAAKLGSSARVKAYLIKILQGPRGPERSQALSALAHTLNLRGDTELYSTLEKELTRRDGDNDLPVLGAMKGIDGERTLPILLSKVDKTTSVRRFIAISGALSQYKRPAVLEHIIRRIPDFPRKSWGDPENATLGIADDDLLHYIKDADGENLKLALYTLDQDASALRKCAPVLLSRLDKGAPQSRRVVAGFLKQTAGLATSPLFSCQI
jgi:hypothetical protein